MRLDLGCLVIGLVIKGYVLGCHDMDISPQRILPHRAALASLLADFAIRESRVKSENHCG